jgi:hypothetical protein
MVAINVQHGNKKSSKLCDYIFLNYRITFRTGYGLDRVFLIRFPAKVRNFSLFQSAQTGLGNPNSYSTDGRGVILITYFHLVSKLRMSGANHHCRNIISWQPLQFDKIHENLQQRLSAFS